MIDPAVADPSRANSRSLAIPLGILSLALLVWVGFQTWQLVDEHARLVTLRTSQESLIANSKKLRVSLDTLALESAQLAAQGNPSARILVEELRKRGITINPSQQAGK